MTDKKIVLYIIAAALIGGFVGSNFNGATNAASLRDFFKNLIPQLPVFTVPQLPVSTQTEEKPAYVPALDYEEALIKAVEKAEPGVVSIIVTKDLPKIGRCTYDPFGDLPPEFRQFFGGGFNFEQPCPQGTERREIGGGSGFVLDSNGTIVTNKHVVSDAKADYTVLTNDGKKYAAKVLARDPLLDFAVLKISADGLRALALGNSDGLKLGQTAIAIGNALGEFRNTVSVGAVSGLARNVTARGGGVTETIEGVIQTDAAINPGNSGGPLLNLRGEVIGINTAVAAGAENIGFAIPINQVKRAIDSIRQHGKIIIPYLGVRYIVIDDERAEKEKLAVKYGALVRGGEDGPAIVKNSPAEKAGIKAEDIILEVNGQKIDKDHPLASLIQKYSVGDAITLKVLRGGQALELKVTLEERPSF